MKIKHLFIGIALTANLFAATAQEVKKTYFVSKPGTLISMMTEEEANQVTHLTLTGKINAVDFRHLRDEFKNLQVLDIANASISMYSGKEGTYPDKFYIYMPNFVPAYAFCKMENGTAKGKSTLKKIILSEKIKNIEDAAFMGCENLKNITVKTTKLTKKRVGSKAFSGIHAKAAIKVPKKKLSAYRKMLKARGVAKKENVRASR